MSGRLAPVTEGADPRMNLRGFGGAQSAIAVYTLLSARTSDRARQAVLLNALTDGWDTVVSLMELRDRGRLGPVVAGGIGINVVGLTWEAMTARALQ